MRIVRCNVSCWNRSINDGMGPRNFSQHLRTVAGSLVVFWCCLSPPPTNACGPDFPNWLLALGDNAVLVAPEGNFAAELARMNLGPSRIQAIPPADHDHAAQSELAEVNDLREALVRSGLAADRVESICEAHQAERQKLAAFAETLKTWKWLHRNSDLDSAPSDQVGPRRAPAPGNIQVVPGLPGEFADYFEGFIAWHTAAQSDPPDYRNARAAWERLMSRPPSERRYKSTWASFMLGKSWQKQDPEKAITYFKQVRKLAFPASAIR